MKHFVIILACIAMFSAGAISQPVVNGDLSDAHYILLGAKLNANTGFGGGLDIKRIVYYADVSTGQLYIGLVGKLQFFSDNGIGLWLNFSGIAGKAAGQALGGTPGGHYMSGNGGSNVNFKADFQVDYMFALNPGSVSNTHVYVDAVKLVGGRFASYLGDCGPGGVAITGPASSGDFFAQNSVLFAFNNAGTANTGLEIRIPFGQLGISSADSLEAFACVVSATSYFSNLTVPGDLSAEPGYEPNFNTLATGPFHTATPGPLPVQLASFTASVQPSQSVRLDWRTLSEINNFGFYVERGAGSTFSEITGSFVPGNGTTNVPNEYSFVDNSPSAATSYYRLRQMDLDGRAHYSEPIHVDLLTGVDESTPRIFALKQNYPNPFNPSTEISFSVGTTGHTTLEVYDLLGQKVATLFDRVAESGHSYNVRMDAGNLSSGMYLYRLSNGSNTDLKKMMLMR